MHGKCDKCGGQLSAKGGRVGADQVGHARLEDAIRCAATRKRGA